MNDKTYYLDHAAATPVDERVLAAMLPYFSERFYNPSSPYAPAVEVRRDYDDAKRRLANCIGGKGDEIVITAGATESINLMFGSVAGHVVTTAIEHPAVLEVARRREAAVVDVDRFGNVRAEDIARAIRQDTELVSVALANSEIGTIQPLREIAEVVRQERARRAEAGETRSIYFHSDASQGVGQIDVHVARLGVDALTINAGKIYGPKQMALLWMAPIVRPEPYILGGGQERGLRSGTENVAGVMGFARALEIATEHHVSESKRLAEMRDRLEEQLVGEFPKAVASGNPRKRLPGHLHVSIPGLDAERLVFLLESQGVYVATGSACAANKGTRSHVLVALGLDDDTINGSLRLTFGRLNDISDIDRLAVILVDTIKKEQLRAGKG